MKITIFQSDKGDCLLIEGSEGTTILADGGMASSYSQHVAPTLGRMREADRALDLVYVSHIDADHIAGVLRMMDDEVKWRVFEFQRQQRNPRLRRFEPDSPRPPEVKQLWHNAFRDQITRNRGELEDLLIAAMQTNLLDEDFRDNLGELDNLITSERQALLLMHRLSKKQLDVPVNSPTGGHLMFIGESGTVSGPIDLGELRITVVGPRQEELERLRDRWNQWIRDNRDAIRRIREQARVEAERLHADEAASFRGALKALAQQLGDRSKVTVPNLASLMLVVEDQGKSLLLTGDSHPDDIIAGLEQAGRLDGDGRCRFDVIKVQHHGSEHNMNQAFGSRITAENYLFCGDGAHHNPDLEAVGLLIDERRAACDRRFRLWFNSSERVTRESRQEHMRKLRALVERRSERSNGQLRYRFLTRGSKISLRV